MATRFQICGGLASDQKVGKIVNFELLFVVSALRDFQLR